MALKEDEGTNNKKKTKKKEIPFSTSFDEMQNEMFLLIVL